MCVAPTMGAATSQPKPAAQQNSEGIAQASPAVWQLLASKGGLMGKVAQDALNPLPPALPAFGVKK